MADCEHARRTAYATLGMLDPVRRLSEEDLEAALRHIRRCPECRREMEPEHRGKFVSLVILGRD